VNGGSTVNSSLAQSYSLYPNPSQGNITIEQAVNDDVTMVVRVINYAGATVYNGNLGFTGGKAMLDVTHVGTGMYLVQLVDAKGNVQTFKMVIEK
jgi:hypothetical protein